MIPWLKNFKSPSATRKFGACTHRVNEIKAILVPGGNVEMMNESAELFHYFKGQLMNLLRLMNLFRYSCLRK